MTSVRLLPEKYCAFINFKTKESAGAAMKGLQVGAIFLLVYFGEPLSMLPLTMSSHQLSKFDYKTITYLVLKITDDLFCMISILQVTGFTCNT